MVESSPGALLRRGSLVSLLVAAVGRAAAHEGSHEAGQGHGLPAWIPLTAFALGGVLVGASLVADRRDLVAPQYADAALAVGAVALLVGIGGYVV
jgi:hypothetical protein